MAYAIFDDYDYRQKNKYVRYPLIFGLSDFDLFLFNTKWSRSTFHNPT